MRTRFLLLVLCAAACSNDDDRGRFELSSDPSTASDGGDPRQVAPRNPDSGSNAIGSDVGGGGPRRGMDASVADATVSDARSSDSATPSGYACQTSNDCTIVNVGSCCGYFPRCANANAIFTQPNCPPGQGGICGFPSINGCTCELGQCVSLQDGVRVNYP